jgi:hypothetical protein
MPNETYDNTLQQLLKQLEESEAELKVLLSSGAILPACQLRYKRKQLQEKIRMHLRCAEVPPLSGEEECN